MKINSAHQPNFWPYLGVWEKFLISDAWVWVDDAQFTESDYQQRFEVVAPGGRKRKLSLSVSRSLGDLITEVGLVPGTVDKDIVGKLQAWYPRNSKEVVEFLTSREWGGLFDLTYAVCKWICEEQRLFGSDLPDTVLASELANKGNATERIVADCRSTGCNIYLAGASGRCYMDMPLMREAGIVTVFQDFEPFEYSQWHSRQAFVPMMSVLDCMLNNAQLDEFVIRCKTLRSRILERAAAGAWEIDMRDLRDPGRSRVAHPIPSESRPSIGPAR